MSLAYAWACANAAVGVAQASDGATLFTQNCLMCHQSGGAGLAGQFPRLAGRVAAISSKPGGRAYLIDVLTYGMTGTIVVDAQPIMGLMPPFASIANDDAAAILSYLQSLGDAPAPPPALFTAEEFRVGRTKSPKTAADVQAERQVLQRDKVIL